jgi:hypothetical protein
MSLWATISSWWARIPGSGSFRWSTFLEFLGVFVAAIAALAASCAANDAETTSKRVQEIEEERHDDERLEDLMAAQMARFFTSSCDNKMEMLAPKVERYFDTRDLTAAQVVEKCNSESGQSRRTFVLHGIDVIGTPAAGRANALVDRGFYDTGDHVLSGVTSLEVVVEVHPGWEDDEQPIFPIVSITETVVETD